MHTSRTVWHGRCQSLCGGRHAPCWNRRSDGYGYYDDRSRWQKSRNKITTAVEAGAAVGGLLGGKKGAIIGAIAGAVAQHFTPIRFGIIGAQILMVSPINKYGHVIER